MKLQQKTARQLATLQKRILRQLQRLNRVYAKGTSSFEHVYNRCLALEEAIQKEQIRRLGLEARDAHVKRE